MKSLVFKIILIFKHYATMSKFSNIPLDILPTAKFQISFEKAIQVLQ